MSLVKEVVYKITQTRSTIGMPPIIRANIKSLGLRKKNQIVYQTVSPSTAHKLAKVKEIIKVELATERKDVHQLAQDRKFAPGFKIIKGGATRPVVS